MASMLAALHAILWLGGVLGAECAPVGFLHQPAFCCDRVLRGPAEPYYPQPGDLVFFTDYKYFWCATHDWAGAGHPHHSGIVVARPDGRLASLEAGPYYTLRVKILDLGPDLRKYTELGEPVWVRRRKIPLTCEQSEQLTAFALTQEGKRFALIRQGTQLTPFRSRMPLRIHFMARCHPDRCSYFCSEIVTEALAAACLIDPETARPAATYPSDLFYGRSANHYINEHLDLSDWYPPARWLECPFPEVGVAGR